MIETGSMHEGGSSRTADHVLRGTSLSISRGLRAGRKSASGLQTVVERVDGAIAAKAKGDLSARTREGFAQ